MGYNPYRIGCSYWWKYWTYLPGDITRFLGRLWTYAPVLFSTCRCCDYSTLQLLEVRFTEHLKDFEGAHIKHNGHEKDVKRIQMCQILLKRIVANDYGMELEGYKPSLYPHKEWYSEYMVKQDLNMLCDTMKKYLRHWWI